MLKYFLVTISMFWGITLSSQSVAAKWYAVTTYSYSNAELVGDAPSFLSIDRDDTDSGWQLTGGFQYNPYFSLELGWVDYGTHRLEISSDFTNISGVAPAVRPNFNGGALFSNIYLARPAPVYVDAAFPFATNSIVYGPPAELETSTKGLRMAANGRLPLTELFSLTIQGGVIFTRYENKSVSYVPTIDTVNPISVSWTAIENTETSRDAEFFAGVGMEFDINQRFAVKLFWERILDLGDANTLEQDLDSYNLGLLINF